MKYHKLRVHLKPEQWQHFEQLRQEYERDHNCVVPPGAFANRLLVAALQQKNGGQGR